MKLYFNFRLTLLCLIFVTLLASCSNDDDIAASSLNPGQTDLDTQDFIWKTLNLWYFWQADVPDLADNRFNSNTEYSNYLLNFSDPESFFYDTLLFSEDRFSVITDDYNELIQSQQGISLSTGVDYQLYLFNGDSGDIFGVVQYIIPGTDAEGKNIKRGDIFIGVNGQDLNISNYRDLLSGSNTSLIFNMADINNDVITANGGEVELIKTQVTENPVLIQKTFDIAGHKIGYLMYNRFTENFDVALNDAFGFLKSEGVTDLVLDLRYNPGGRVSSAVLLASLITGQFTNEVFIRQRWNDKIQANFSDNQLTDRFINTFTPDSGGGSIELQSLGLNRVFVLTTEGTASASELVMNGLDPYIPVTQIGDTTSGKNEFSLTFVDDPDNSYLYDADRENNINSNNQWGLQPLTGRNENAAGFSDYTAGLVPNEVLLEDLNDYGILGNQNEPLLARALETITGVTIRSTVYGSKKPLINLTTKPIKVKREIMWLDKKLNPALP